MTYWLTGLELTKQVDLLLNPNRLNRRSAIQLVESLPTPQTGSLNRQSSANFILFQLYQNCVEKTKKKKEAGFGTIFLKDVAINKCLQKYEVDKFLRAGYFFIRF